MELIWVILRLSISDSVIKHRFLPEKSKGWVISCRNTSIISEWTAACFLANSLASSSESVASLLLHAILEKNDVICCGRRNSFTVKIRFPLLSLKHLISFETSSGFALIPVVSPCVNFSPRNLLCLELNRWRGMADSRQAHPSGRRGEPLCISVSGIVTSGWLPSASRRSA